MTHFLKQIQQQWIVPILVGASLLLACKKDKVPCTEPVPEPTKWEKIAGTYKVYDTVGVYMYEMIITHSFNSDGNQDILTFTNFDEEFDFSSVQSNSDQDPEFLVLLGYQDTLYDNADKRWKIIHSFDDVYNNVLQNDTIRLNFEKTNINYYIEDLTPYYACNCKQIAVKQH